MIMTGRKPLDQGAAIARQTQTGPGTIEYLRCDASDRGHPLTRCWRMFFAVTGELTWSSAMRPWSRTDCSSTSGPISGRRTSIST